MVYPCSPTVAASRVVAWVCGATSTRQGRIGGFAVEASTSDDVDVVTGDFQRLVERRGVPMVDGL